MFSYQFLCTFTVAPHNGHPTRWGLHLFIANHGLQPTMVCMDISTPMTHGYMASVFVIPPTSSICGPSQRVASVTLLTGLNVIDCSSIHPSQSSSGAPPHAG